MNYWLIKSEPYKYSWQQLVKDGRTMWDGVRNYQARNNLKAMKRGDQAFFYHSNEGLCIVGIAEVVKEHYPDPTAKGTHNWVVVDVVPIRTLDKSIHLADLKQRKDLQQLSLIKQPRLSVVPIKKVQWHLILG